MGRPRGKRNSGLPAGVYCAKGRYFQREPGMPERFVAPATATKQEVWEAYLKLPARVLLEVRDKPTVLRDLFKRFMESPQWKELSLNSRRDAKSSFAVMSRQLGKNGQEFGDCPLNIIRRSTMRLYMDKRGTVTKRRANAELAYASIAFSWGAEREMVEDNPCKGIKKYRIDGRTRYITDEEYAERHKLAGDTGRRDVQVMMELAYLCRLRENEIVKMLDSPRFIRQSGVLAVRGKGSKTQLIEWSPRLEAAIAAARAMKQEVIEARAKRRKATSPTLCLITTRYGRALTLRAFANAWQELRAVAVTKQQPIDWTFHDLKAKGVSDFEGIKQEGSGHRTAQMTTLYDRLEGVVKSTK